MFVFLTFRDNEVVEIHLRGRQGPVYPVLAMSLRWRHNGRDGVSNHQPHDCLPNRFFRRRSRKTSKLRVTGLCAGISPGTGEFPTQMASNAENVSIWWRHHVMVADGLVKQCAMLLVISDISDRIQQWYRIRKHFVNIKYGIKLLLT